MLSFIAFSIELTLSPPCLGAERGQAPPLPVDERDPIDGVGQGGDARRVDEQRGKVGATTHRSPFFLTTTSIDTTRSVAAQHGSQRPLGKRLGSPHDGHARPPDT